MYVDPVGTVFDMLGIRCFPEVANRMSNDLCAPVHKLQLGNWLTTLYWSHSEGNGARWNETAEQLNENQCDKHSIYWKFAREAPLISRAVVYTALPHFLLAIVICVQAVSRALSQLWCYALHEYTKTVSTNP